MLYKQNDSRKADYLSESYGDYLVKQRNLKFKWCAWLMSDKTNSILYVLCVFCKITNGN